MFKGLVPEHYSVDKPRLYVICYLLVISSFDYLHDFDQCLPILILRIFNSWVTKLPLLGRLLFSDLASRNMLE